MRHAIIKYLVLAFLVVYIGCSQEKNQRDMPNILWVSCEDITTMLGCYGDKNARTPHLDAFAKRGIIYSNAYATAPVCSPARSCIITGNYATTLGTQHLRSQTQIPDFIIPFPRLLREAGYFVTNNAKEDYNFKSESIWDESSKAAHWRSRKSNQPFFSVFNFGITHQSGIFGDDSAYEKKIEKYIPFIKRSNPDSLILPLYYPDSPGIRELWARYYTNVSIVDYQFSQVLKELEEDGLSDETIVFFFSDHGTGMPRSKRALYDSGLKIPLLVYVPEKWQKELNVKPGSVNDQLVSFVDFAPTIIDLAQIEQREYLQGKSFLPVTEGREKSFVYGTSDRVDEAYEVARTIRTNDFRYTRNFMPHLPLLQPNFYTDQSEIMKELNKIDKSTLNKDQLTMFEPFRMPEELYDIKNDPYEVNNLASDPAYLAQLKIMRKQLNGRIRESFDTGLIPEPEMIRLSTGQTTYEWAHDSLRFPVDRILSACDLMLSGEPSSGEILEYLNDGNGLVRYWTLIAIQAIDFPIDKIRIKLRELLTDDFATVQMEASKLLIQDGELEAISVLHNQLKNKPHFALYAARTYQFIASFLSEFPAEFMEAYKLLKEETNDGSLNTKNYYKLYTYWALSETLKQ